MVKSDIAPVTISIETQSVNEYPAPYPVMFKLEATGMQELRFNDLPEW